MKFSKFPLVPATFFAALTLVSTFVTSGQTPSPIQRVTEAVDLEKLVTLHGNVLPLVRPQFDRGAVDDGQPLRRMLLVLQRAPEQESELRQLLDEQQIKSSLNYHKWLTPAEFGARFGPSDPDIQATTDWLSSQGFQVNRIAAGRTVIEFSGTAGQVRQALHTEMHKYMVNGVEHLANASDPQIPAALSPVVRGVVSLNDFRRHAHARHLGTFSRSRANGELRPLFTFTGGSGQNFAVGPADFATIYNVLPLWTGSPAIDGTGQSIAVVSASNIDITDARDFRSIFGLPARDPQIILDGPDPGLTSDESEADLDVEWAGAVAKNATIKLVVSSDTETSFGVDLAALRIVDDNLAPVLSDSYGSCEGQMGSGGNAYYNALWEQAAAEGITVIVASGDSGSAECDDPNSETAAQFGLAVDGLASTPFNVAMGGTDFNDSTSALTYWNTSNSTPAESSAKSYIPELPWNDSCARLLGTASSGACGTVRSTGQDLAAAGGGPSSIYPQPSWQTGPGVPSDGKRHLPDVSLFSGDGLNGNFLVYCEADANTGSNTTSCNLSSPFTNFQGAGGTSFATPAFAGVMAMVNQKTGERQGNANYVLYPLAAMAAGNTCASDSTAVTKPSCIFYDQRNGNISVACKGGSPNCSNSSSAANQFGVLVNPLSPTNLAWPAANGYDMATGLGSVNVANLVNQWASVNFSSTTTTLVSLSPTTITHGQPVDVHVTVTSGSGTPTGDVVLANASAIPFGMPPLTLTGGAITATTTFLPGGRTYSVRAHYAGDGAFGASDSASPGISLTVNPETSKTALGLVTFDFNTGAVLSTNAPTAAYGSPYILRGDVTNHSGNPCTTESGPTAYGCPTGDMAITFNALPLGGGTFGLNSQGYTEDILIQLPANSTAYSLAATYSGDASYAGSSTTDVITITQAPATLALTSSASTVQVGANVTLTATLGTQSNGDAPAGTVQFLNGGTPIAGTVAYVRSPYDTSTFAPASLQATLVTSFASVATDTITANFGGDSNYANATSAPVTVTVTAAPPGFTLAANPSSISISSAGQSGSSTITVSPTNGFTGSVSLSCTVPAAMREASCTMSPNSVSTSGTSTLSVTTTAPHTVGSLYRVPIQFLPYGGLFILASLVLLTLLSHQRRAGLVLGFASACLMAAIAAGCGGGGSSGGGTTTDPGTPAGTYTVTVSGTSGSITQTATVSVTVH